MALPQTGPITESINSLRTESSPDSVTPARVANLLQAIVDLINALSMVPDSEVTNIMQLLNNAVSTANAASSAASAAQTNANNKKITQFKADAAADAVTLTVKQSGHTALTFSFPVADASHAGIVLPAVLQSITDAAALGAKNRLTSITFSYSVAGLTLNFKDADGASMLTKTLPTATQSRAGLMSASHCEKLDHIPPDGVAPIDDAGRVPGVNAPQVMLRTVADPAGEFDTHPLQVGDFYFESGVIWYQKSATNTINMGSPNKDVVYCHTETDSLYRWNGSTFTPIRTSPNSGLEHRRIRVYTTASKRYDIPSGVYAEPHPTTSVMNINLLPPSSGVPVYHIWLNCGGFYDDSDALIVEQINWPLDLQWENEAPTVDDVIENFGVLVTIYDQWASFKKF